MVGLDKYTGTMAMVWKSREERLVLVSHHDHHRQPRSIDSLSLSPSISLDLSICLSLSSHTTQQDQDEEITIEAEPN